MVWNQRLAVEQIIGTQTNGICFLAVFAFAVGLLFLGFTAFTRYDGYNRSVDMRAFSRPYEDEPKPHSPNQMYRTGIVCCLDTIHRACHFVNSHPILVCSRHLRYGQLSLGRWLSFAWYLLCSVGRRLLRPAIHSIGICNQRHIKMRSCRVGIVRYYFSPQCGRIVWHPMCLCLLYIKCEISHIVCFSS